MNQRNKQNKQNKNSKISKHINQLKCQTFKQVNKQANQNQTSKHDLYNKKTGYEHVSTLFSLLTFNVTTSLVIIQYVYGIKFELGNKTTISNLPV